MPWRGGADPWGVWVSEIMLQQTRVDTVTGYWGPFMQRFPTPTALADAAEQEVLSYWQGLGYYRRARLLHRASQVVRDEHGGVVPADPDDFQSLPGVGRYTAGAVMSIAFGRRAPILDGNVIRVLSRFFRVEGDPRSPDNQRRLWSLAERVLPAEGQGDPGDFNQALMDLGATVCTPPPGHPHCLACPLHEGCDARLAGMQASLPAATAKTAVKRIAAACALFEDPGGRWLIARRPDAGLLAGLWELPGVELRPRQRAERTVAKALVTGLGERLGVQIPAAALSKVGEVGHVFTHRKLTLTVFRCGRWSGQARAAGHYPEVRWLDPAAPGVPLPKVTRKVMGLIQSRP